MKDKSVSKIDYTARNRKSELNMHKEGKNHNFWKDRMRAEKVGIFNSLTRGMEMDMIGSVPVDKQLHLKIFQQQQSKNYINENEKLKSNHRRVLNLSTLERKEKLLEFIQDQKRGSAVNNDDYHVGDWPQNQRQYNEQPTYEDNLPPLLNKQAPHNAQSIQNYYLSHKIDLSHPEVLHVNIKDANPYSLIKRNAPQIETQDNYIENLLKDNSRVRDNMKIQNRQISPDELQAIQRDQQPIKELPKNFKKMQFESNDSPWKYQTIDEGKQTQIIVKKIERSLERLQPITSLKSQRRELPRPAAGSNIYTDYIAVQSLDPNTQQESRQRQVSLLTSRYPVPPIKVEIAENTSYVVNQMSPVEYQLHKQAQNKMIDIKRKQNYGYFNTITGDPVEYIPPQSFPYPQYHTSAVSSSRISYQAPFGIQK